MSVIPNMSVMPANTTNGRRIRQGAGKTLVSHGNLGRHQGCSYRRGKVYFKANIQSPGRMDSAGSAILATDQSAQSFKCEATD